MGTERDPREKARCHHEKYDVKTNKIVEKPHPGNDPRSNNKLDPPCSVRAPKVPEHIYNDHAKNCTLDDAPPDITLDTGTRREENVNKGSLNPWRSKNYAYPESPRSGRS